MVLKLFRGIEAIWYYIWGNIFALIIYDKKFVRGKYFLGRYGPIGGIGWKWIVTDFQSRVILGINRGVPFPISPRVSATIPQNIDFHVDDLNNFQAAGCYFQAYNNGRIIIGKGTWIAPNVGIIASNHDLLDPDKHLEGKQVIIGEKCWIGMNSVILPEVILGQHTVVGAGSIVTKSFPEGYCIIAGNPARKIRDVIHN